MQLCWPWWAVQPLWGYSTTATGRVQTGIFMCLSMKKTKRYSSAVLYSEENEKLWQFLHSVVCSCVCVCFRLETSRLFVVCERDRFIWGVLKWPLLVDDSCYHFFFVICLSFSVFYFIQNHVFLWTYLSCYIHVSLILPRKMILSSLTFLNMIFQAIFLLDIK